MRKALFLSESYKPRSRKRTGGTSVPTEISRKGFAHKKIILKEIAHDEKDKNPADIAHKENDRLPENRAESNRQVRLFQPSID